MAEIFKHWSLKPIYSILINTLNEDISLTKTVACQATNIYKYISYMPQIIPIWWEILIIAFILTRIFFIIIIYHNKSLKIKIRRFKKPNNNKIWLW